MNGRSQFHAICEAVAGIIRHSSLIPADVAVVAYERGEIESEIERSLGTLGLCVVVLPFEPVHSLNGSMPPFYDEADLIIHILERPAINTTGVDGACIRDAVALELSGKDADGLLSEPLSEHRIIRADDADLTIREMIWRAVAQLRP